MSRAIKARKEEMRPEYDIRGGVRGKYRQGTNIVQLADVAAVFHDSKTVNRALRMLIDLAKEQAGNPPSKEPGA